MSVLIVTVPDDVHALAVRWAITEVGGRADIIYPADLGAGGCWSCEATGTMLRTHYGAETGTRDISDYRTVWMRRPPSIFPQEGLHDKVDRANIEKEFAAFAQSLYLLLERNRFAVNPTQSNRSASLKPLQVVSAKSVGFNVPRTLIGNSPSDIVGFHDECDGKVVFKPFSSSLWRRGNGATMVPVSMLTSSMLRETDLSAAPGIFQEWIDKTLEVRVTVMGRATFAWEKRPQEDLASRVDWSYMKKGVSYSRHDLPEEIRLLCTSLLSDLGLVFGCIDLMVDRHGSYFFIEVNPQGQWLWGDSLLPELNQLEAMSLFLLSEDADFTYRPLGKVSYEAFKRLKADGSIPDDGEEHFGSFTDMPYYQQSFSADAR